MYTIACFTDMVVCYIIPYISVIDSQFINIFTFDYIRKFNQLENQKQDEENAQNIAK